MASSQATLGYASRTEAVVALRASGHSTDMIAQKIGIAPKTVNALELAANRARDSGGRTTPNAYTLTLTMDVMQALRPHAAKRGLTSLHLARLIVETVVDDKMVDAVLDDAASQPVRARGRSGVR